MLDRLQSLSLNGNPWTEPPESIVRNGSVAIEGYFEDLYAEPCRVQRKSVKVILVGQERAGKTRWVRVLARAHYRHPMR